MSKDTPNMAHSATPSDHKGSSTVGNENNTTVARLLSPVEKVSINPLTGEVTSKTYTSATAGTNTDEHPPLFELPSKSLEQLTQLKRGAEHVAKCLAFSKEKRQVDLATEIANCCESLHLNSETKLRPNFRCKSKLCPLCSHIQSEKVVARFNSALGYLPFTLDGEAHDLIPINKRMIGVKVNLNSGEPCELHQIRARFEAMNKTLSSVIRLKDIKDDLIGYIASREVTESRGSTGLKARPHLHCLFLVRADYSHDLIKTLVYKYRASLRKYIALNQDEIVNTEASATFDSVTPLWTQTREHLISWIRYATKGSYDLFGHSKSAPNQRLAQQSTHEEYWWGLERELHRMKMISTGGLLRSAMGEAEKEHKAEKRAKNKIGRPAKTPTVEVKWSRLDRAYLTPCEIEKRYSPDSIMGLMSHTKPIPNFERLFRAQYLFFKEKQRKGENRALIQLINSGYIDPNSEYAKKTLILTKYCQDREREPSEVERQAPQHGAPIDPRMNPVSEPK